MAISQVGGASNQSTSSVSTLSVTYAPTTGHTVVLFLNTSAAITALTVTDSASNPLIAGAVSGNVRVYYQLSAPAGITGYTASWTTAAQCSLAVEEYSGVTGVNALSTYVSNNGNASSLSLSITISEPNNWIVTGFGASNTMTGTVGTQRQQTTTSTARVTLMDNTAASISSVTTTITLTTTAINAVGVELGGTGNARDNQDLTLVGAQPSTAEVRDNQDLLFAMGQITTSQGRLNQELVLGAAQVTSAQIRINQELILIAVPSVTLHQPLIFVVRS